MLDLDPPEQGTVISDLEIREIWVDRHDGDVEYKPWLIYTLILNDSAQKKIAEFIEAEMQRFPLGVKHNPDALKRSITSYSLLEPADENLPPRLIWFNLSELNSLPTQLVYREGFTLGDSIGGIGYGRPREHNSFVGSTVAERHRVLFSPGILSRIPILVKGDPHFIFQLAEKNLRNKGELFYKPIGGHMKYTEALDPRLTELGLERKFRSQPQDFRDLAFFVTASAFTNFQRIFFDEIYNKSQRRLIVPPEKTLIEELEEEIGPIHSSDGVPLLTFEDLRPYDYKTG